MVEPVSLTISTVAAFWDLATSLFDLAGKFREQDATRRAEVSRYFADIADYLDKTAASLTNGVYPDGQCAALGTHANNLQNNWRLHRGNQKRNAARTSSDKPMQSRGCFLRLSTTPVCGT